VSRGPTKEGWATPINRIALQREDWGPELRKNQNEDGYWGRKGRHDKAREFRRAAVNFAKMNEKKKTTCFGGRNPISRAHRTRGSRNAGSTALNFLHDGEGSPADGRTIIQNKTRVRIGTRGQRRDGGDSDV